MSYTKQTNETLDKIAQGNRMSREEVVRYIAQLLSGRGVFRHSTAGKRVPILSAGFLSMQSV